MFCLVTVVYLEFNLKEYSKFPIVVHHVPYIFCNVSPHLLFDYNKSLSLVGFENWSIQPFMNCQSFVIVFFFFNFGGDKYQSLQLLEAPSQPLYKVECCTESKFKPVSVKYQAVIRKQTQNSRNFCFLCNLREVLKLHPQLLWTITLQEKKKRTYNCGTLILKLCFVQCPHSYHRGICCLIWHKNGELILLKSASK